jgi:predicted RNA-binding Zn-ribbon protein involved in translation (DUF1610 family)
MPALIVHGTYHFRPTRVAFRNDYCIRCAALQVAICAVGSDDVIRRERLASLQPSTALTCPDCGVNLIPGPTWKCPKCGMTRL